MILVDANLLIYSQVSTLPQHEAARSWFDDRLNGSIAVGVPWESLLAFVRIASNPRIFERPVGVEAAWSRVEEWLACPPVWTPGPTDRHTNVVGGLLRGQSMRANLVPDAHLAGIAIEHGLILCSTDGDFARFRGLKWENPLMGSA